MPVAVVTGASKGLGRALADALATDGWTLVLDARTTSELASAAAELASLTTVHPVAGDVTDPAHRAELAAVVDRLGRLDLLVNNASTLGAAGPLSPLARYPHDALEEVYRVNVFAPLALAQLFLPRLREASGTVIDVSSDAAVEAYPGWGGYGSAKAALDQVSAVLAAEEPAVRVYAVDPGDMRTDMHQAAFPDDDISDRPAPATVVPAFLCLLATRPPSGRYTAARLLDSALDAAVAR